MRLAAPARTALLVIAPILLTGATWRVTFLGNAVLAGGMPTAGAEREIAPGEVVEQSAVGARSTAVLMADVKADIGGRSYAYASGSALAEVLLDGRHVGELGDRALQFCSRDTPRWCIADRDADGIADYLLLPDLAGAQPMPIATRYAPRKDVALPGESAVRLRYLGVSGRGMLRFRLELVESGKKIVFGNGFFRADAGALPLSITPMGSELSVTAIDRATQHIQVTIKHPMPAAPYNIDLREPGLLDALFLGPNVRFPILARDPDAQP